MDTHLAYLSIAAQSPIFDKFLTSCLVFGNYVRVSITVRRIYTIFPTCIIMLHTRAKFPFTVFFWRLEGIIFSWLFRLVSKPNTVRYFVLEPAVVCYIMLKSTLMLIIKSMSFCCNLVLEQVSAPVKNFSKTNISSKKLAFLRQFPFEFLTFQ